MGPTGFEGVRQPKPPTSERSEAVRVWLLGGFRVSVGPRRIEQSEWRLKKATALVKVLALAPGHRLHREQAMEALWPEVNRKAASNSLRTTLHATRKILESTEGSRYLASQDDSLVLCPQGQLLVDVDAFEEAVAAAHRSRDPAAFSAAIDLYSGELLPENRYEQWAEARREELRRTWLSLHLELSRVYEERGDCEGGIEVLQRAISKEPTNEEAHAGLMRLYALCERRGDALRQYERLREVLSRELLAEPDATTRRLHEDIAASRFPPVQPTVARTEKPFDAGKHNLPAARTSFVGREREMVEVKRTLAMTRLLTLTGAGGSGKTRLSLEIARDLIGAYPDGVWLVELAPLSEGDLVAQEVAGALEISERPGEPLIDTLVDVIGSKNLLVVLDTCEHLVEAAARLTDTLLCSCPHLRVLATSREPLGVGGEVLWRVPALSLPDSTDGKPDGESAIESLVRYEAVRLFVDRARLRLPDFGLTTENARAVAGVCRKLEGIPLAIELATARMGALAVEQVAQRLEVSFEVLKGASRTAAPRQQTLRATLDWSYDLLSEAEQILFGRLSVFAGGWTLEAAEAVCSGGGIEEDDVLDLLGSLVDKSLVVAEAARGGAVRYRMLEPIRQYAKEKLQASGDVEVVQAQHTEFFLAVAKKAQIEFWGPEEAVWSERLEVEHDNLRAALLWTLECGEAEPALHLTGALSWFWEARSHVSEGARWLEQALAMGGAATKTAHAGALLGLGNILKRSDIERAQACLEEALALYKGLGNRERVAEAMSLLGWVADYRGDQERAAVLYEEGLRAARNSEDRRLIGSFLNQLAYHAFEGKDFYRAQELWEEALVLNREEGGPLGTTAILINMGYTELVKGDQGQAKKLLEESLALSQEAGDKSHVAGSLMCLGIAATLQGEPERARVLLKDSLAMDLELGSKIDIAEDLEGLAEAAGELGQHIRAARLWGAAGALREEIGVQWAPAERMLHEPQLAAARSRIDGAIWETGFGEGQVMGLEEAVEYALSEEDTAMTEPPAPGQPSSDARSDALTRREEEVARLVARGLSNRQIASHLMLSEHTIATHIRNLLKKLGLNSRTQIAAYFTEQH